LDTVLPAVPALGTPDDGAWVRSLQLTATFNKPSFAGTGTVEFRICSDALCLGVVRTGSSGSVINGAGADWTPTSSPGDGLWYWQSPSIGRATSGRCRECSSACPIWSA